MRSIGMDVHRSFAQLAVVENGLCRDEGRIGAKPQDLRAWAQTLEPGDEVALEATTTEGWWPIHSATGASSPRFQKRRMFSQLCDDG